MLNKILCVDDDPITLMLCKKVIAKANFSSVIESAKDGIEALKFFDSNKDDKVNEDYPQIIFLDLNMPIMDGWEFLEEFNNFKESFPHTKIIVLSSSVDPKDINKSKNYSMVLDFLPKPITVEMLNSIKYE
jgi:CheY-like chemotaxis protein